ncbi:GNAT family N-acetyltransferase [Nocardioides sp.]|uniref:GNAT family N-acetyltransferase n=1 Tax=Nocardioides sp. TaxID=35761 RepID=UPI00286BF942|nr:GNAT family N-acetyltransferase [Nocardioides sp.]
MPTDLVLRPATPLDAHDVASVHLRARRAAPMPPAVHPDDDVRRWLAVRLQSDEVWVAEHDGAVVGYARLTDVWLDDLYVEPSHARQGVGSALLDVATSVRPDGFCLWVFESNAPARAFYARHGLVELERTDGSANEEHSPDIKMAWTGADPFAFLRGLIDEVDVQLGDLLARRAALTRAVQPLKADPTQRDLAREHQIATALAARAPALGAERIERIVHTIITESLDAART